MFRLTRARGVNPQQPPWSPRRWFVWPLLMLAVALAGPRAHVNGEFSPPVLGTDLAAEIDASEAALAVDPAVAARIVWHDPEKPDQTPLAVVYLHGFSATHRETAPLSEQVAAALGANLYLTRLQGHGLGSAALGAASAESWVKDADRAMAIGRCHSRAVAQRPSAVAGGDCGYGVDLAESGSECGGRATARGALGPTDRLVGDGW